MSKSVSFTSLGIPDYLVEKLLKENIDSPTEVQSEVIPIIIEGKDIIGQSPTGTGKTLAYLLPILSKINSEMKGIQALVLAPTRELAMQITKLANDLMADRGIITVPILGGVNMTRQLDSLKKKPQLLVATPGRVLELIRMRKINSQTIKTIVIDEADKMWSMGFKDDILAIIKTTLRDRQLVMVSATVSPELVADATGILNKPEGVNISGDNQISTTINHIYFLTQEKDKADRLQRLLRIYKPKKAIIFINSNKGVMPFVKRFRDFGFTAEGLNSELGQQERRLVLDKFHSGKAQLLVTTDLFARGMDVKDVQIVFNFDIPVNEEHYIHRVGRTGRAGKEGLAINFVTPDQRFIVTKYQKHLRINIEEYGIARDRVLPVKTIKGSEKIDKENDKKLNHDKPNIEKNSQKDNKKQVFRKKVIQKKD